MISITKKHLLLTLTSTVKTMLVAALVLGLGWSLVQIANWKNRKPTIEATEGGSITLIAADANIIGEGTARLENYAGENNIGWWDSAEQQLEWKANIPHTGIYQAHIKYSLPGQLVTDFDLVCGNTALAFRATGTNGWDKWGEMMAGEIHLEQATNQTITLKATRLPRNESVMNLVEIRLVPLK